MKEITNATRSMKKLVFLVHILVSLNIVAQTANNFNYQCLIRDKQGNPVTNKEVKIKIGIHEGTQNGPVVFSEMHFVTTNDFGLSNLKIGAGELIEGSTGAPEWGNKKYFLNVQADIDQTGYIDFGSSAILSVPYALHANYAEDVYRLHAGDGINYSAPVFTNDAKDQTVTLAAGQNITISGDYPVFSIASYNYENEEQAFFNKKHQVSIAIVNIQKNVNQETDDETTSFENAVQLQKSLFASDSLSIILNRIEHKNDLKDSLEAINNHINNIYDTRMNDYKMHITDAVINEKSWMDDRQNEFDTKRQENDNKQVQYIDEVDEKFQFVQYQIDNVVENKGCFIDPRDSVQYSFKQIGSYIWMTEDLQYKTPGSHFIDGNAEKYRGLGFGRLYNWIEAMHIHDAYETSTFTDTIGHQGICPDGWHLPRLEEWNDLIIAAGGDNSAGKLLKKDADTYYWHNKPNAGASATGFNALGAGYYNISNNESRMYKHEVYFWATNNYNFQAYCLKIEDNETEVLTKKKGKALLGFNIRCVKNY
jgi:uncharacterized protein (TIGR02145 family)